MLIYSSDNLNTAAKYTDKQLKANKLKLFMSAGGVYFTDEDVHEVSIEEGFIRLKPSAEGRPIDVFTSGKNDFIHIMPLALFEATLNNIKESVLKNRFGLGQNNQN